MRGGKRPGAGRKTKAEEDKIREMCLSAAKKKFGSNQGLFDKLAEIAHTAEKDSDKIAAISKLLEYAYGKPKQSMDLDVTEYVPIKPIEWVDG